MFLGRLLGLATLKTGTRRSGEYDRLPASEGGAPSASRLSPVAAWLKRHRRKLVLAFFIFIVSTLWIVYYLVHHPEFWRRKLVLQLRGFRNLPPLYPEFTRAEAQLPQHHTNDPFAGGRKYLWIASHPSCEYCLCCTGATNDGRCRVWLG